MRVTTVAADRVAREAASLLRYKLDLIFIINERIGQIRATEPDFNIGQDMHILLRQDQAQDYIDNPGPGSYPILEAEIGITGATLLEVAEYVLLQRLIFEWGFAELEAIRLWYIQDIENATTKAACDVEFAGFVFTTSPG